MKRFIDRALRMGERGRFRAYEKRVESINAIEPELAEADDDELREIADELRQKAKEGEDLDTLLPEAFALCREAGKRTLGMRHFDVQLIGGMVLHSGAIAEMRTGEGKTLTATLPVFLNSLVGKGVHIVTVNDYLARRDAEWMSPIYEALGMTVGVIQENQTPDERRAAYDADVTFGTNSELGFDYLRDNMANSLEEVVQQRGHPYAIVDEVDNILIDEARTPLIISGRPEQAAELYYTFAKLAKQMDGVPAEDRLKSMGQTRDTSDAEHDFEFDEKHKTIAPTERGVTKAEEFIGVENLFLAENGTLVNHLNQSLKAESLYTRDKDYAVVDGEVKIIDEFTGRILDGRRWSEGLHQAIEAKEGVRIGEENQTLATITLQNYFRLYDKLSGMTGTAVTEATEFKKIYDVDVVEVPTNRPMVRDDHNDQIYRTREGKWEAVIDEISARNEDGQPVLVGTISVEVSEMLSDQLRRRGVEHTVLNAKPEHAEREGEIIAQAGRRGAVTIATNMAGRGVDIKLGGDPEGMIGSELARVGVRADDEAYEETAAEVMPKLVDRCKAEGDDVRELGGLFICGTERHESRRIDNQLRGRSGRQGDPGESRFFLSARDDLIRLFAGDRIERILTRLGPMDEDGNEQPIEAGMLSKAVENAQKKVEEQNFLIRKRVLEYDDVMNEQRRVVYKYRREILEGRDMSEVAIEEIAGVVERTTQSYINPESGFIEETELAELRSQLDQIWQPDPALFDRPPESIDVVGFAEELAADVQKGYTRREEQFGEELMRYLERQILLQIIDNRWREHLFDMDYLREGIHLRGFAQIDPLVAYKNEAFQMFTELMSSIWEEFARVIFNVEVEIEPAEAEEYFESDGPGVQNVDYSGGGQAQPSALYDADGAQTTAGAGEEPQTMSRAERRARGERGTDQAAPSLARAPRTKQRSGRKAKKGGRKAKQQRRTDGDGDGA